MTKSYWDEKWKEIDLEEDKLRYKYAISNYGLIVSYSESLEKRRLLKGSLVDGNTVFRYKQFYKSESVTTIKNKQILIHKFAADSFTEKENDNQQFVIHLDCNKLNNNIDNLKWTSKREMELH